MIFKLKSVNNNILGQRAMLTIFILLTTFTTVNIGYVWRSIKVSTQFTRILPRPPFWNSWIRHCQVILDESNCLVHYILSILCNLFPPINFGQFKILMQFQHFRNSSLSTNKCTCIPERESLKMICTHNISLKISHYRSWIFLPERFFQLIIY